jgi:multisubunit Na+/H+ antiporter MnhE subunit
VIQDRGVRRRRSSRAVHWLAWFAALNLLWLVFISAFDVAETLLGVVASAVAATAASAVRETRLIRFRPRARWILAGWRIPWRTLAETGLVLRVLWLRVLRGKPIAGRFVTQPFPLGRDPERDAARRALFTIGASIAPNTYVVGIDEDEHAALLHELAPQAARRHA